MAAKKVQPALALGAITAGLAHVAMRYGYMSFEQSLAIAGLTIVLCIVVSVAYAFFELKSR